MSLINCPTCGKRISSDAKKCPECDQDLTEFFNDSKKKTSNKKIVLVISIAIILIIVAGFSTFLIFNSKESAKDKLNTDSSTTENDKTNDTTSAEYTGTTPVGVYDGNDHEKLVINDDGLAYYYCSSPEFSELSCPWVYENNEIKIELSKMHCTITADVQNNDFSSLIFRTPSANWNTEEFIKISAEPREYLLRKVLTYDDKLAINLDGTMTLTLGKYIFSIPKQFRDCDVEMPNSNTSIIVDTNVDDHYTSGIVFYTEEDGTIPTLLLKQDKNIDTKITYTATSFSQRFFLNPDIALSEITTINDYPAYIYKIDGRFNKGFVDLAGYDVEVILTLIIDTDNKNVIYILFSQIPDKSIDNTEAYQGILSSFSLK